MHTELGAPHAYSCALGWPWSSCSWMGFAQLQLATYVDGIGPYKHDILPDPTSPLDRSPVIDLAHKHGLDLAVHAYSYWYLQVAGTS